MPPLPMVEMPCSTGCGRTARNVAGSVPREPVRCDACRATLGPRPAVRGHPCDRDGCDQVCPRITGAQRRRWELGRPVYCSPICRTAATSWAESCRYCNTPLLVNRRRMQNPDVVYCSHACARAAARNPEKPCARCGKLFHGLSRRRFCSRACGVRGEGRGDLLAERVCPVCGDRAMVHPRRVGRPCSKACSNTWRTRPDWEPQVRR